MAITNRSCSPRLCEAIMTNFRNGNHGDWASVDRNVTIDQFMIRFEAMFWSTIQRFFLARILDETIPVERSARQPFTVGSSSNNRKATNDQVNEIEMHQNSWLHTHSSHHVHNPKSIMFNSQSESSIRPNKGASIRAEQRDEKTHTQTHWTEQGIKSIAESFNFV